MCWKSTDFLKVFSFFWENKSILFFRNIRMAEKPEKWQNQVGILRNPEQNLQSNRTMCIYLWNDWEMTAAKISCHLGLCLSRIDYHVKRNGYLVHNYNYQRFGWEKKGIMNSCCLGRRACLIKPTIWGCVYQTFADCEKKKLITGMRCADCETQNEEKANVEFSVRISGIYYVVTKVWFEMCRRKITCDKDSGVGFTIRVFFPSGCVGQMLVIIWITQIKYTS